MSEQVQHIDYEKLLFGRAAGGLKVHGILSIVFGSLGVLSGLLFTLLVQLGAVADEHYTAEIGVFIVSAAIFVFWTLPHLYLIVSGIYLVRQPSPKVSRVLTIINLVVGIFYNLVILVMAIISLVQSGDYERGYHTHKQSK